MTYNPTKPYKNKILELIKKTWRTSYVSFREGGAYPVFERKFNYPEIDHTDGIGTKGIFHWQKRSFKNAVIDALAMNLNDLAMAGAVPYKLQCHLILPEDDKTAIMEIMENLVRECKSRRIVITGGETSIQDNFSGFDIGLTVSGFIKKFRENKFRVGDALVGLASDGLHSNGFTAVRKAFGGKFSKEFIEPTKIYLETIHVLDGKYDIHGMMHITGGALTKLKDLLYKTDAVITGDHSLKPHSIFYKIYARNLNDGDMYKTFNCGVGFVLSTSKSDALKIISEVKSADIIGRVMPGTGKVKVNSMFSTRKVVL